MKTNRSDAWIIDLLSRAKEAGDAETVTKCHRALSMPAFEALRSELHRICDFYDERDASE